MTSSITSTVIEDRKIIPPQPDFGEERSFTLYYKAKVIEETDYFLILESMLGTGLEIPADNYFISYKIYGPTYVINDTPRTL